MDFVVSTVAVICLERVVSECVR